MSGDAPHRDVAAAKGAARTQARAARCALDAAACSSAADAVAQTLLSLPELAAARVVLAYSATAEELDLAPTVEALRSRGVAIAYPRVEAPGVLGLHRVFSDADLVPGALGILEPAQHAEQISRAAIDVALVPGVAFNEACCRLGYGGGYYDRLLPTLRPECVRIGIAFDEQVLEPLPAEEHDAGLDAVVTPTHVLRANR